MVTTKQAYDVLTAHGYKVGADNPAGLMSPGQLTTSSFPSVPPTMPKPRPAAAPAGPTSQPQSSTQSFPFPRPGIASRAGATMGGMMPRPGIASRAGATSQPQSSTMGGMIPRPGIASRAGATSQPTGANRPPGPALGMLTNLQTGQTTENFPSGASTTVTPNVQRPKSRATQVADWARKNIPLPYDEAEQALGWLGSKMNPGGGPSMMQAIPKSRPLRASGQVENPLWRNQPAFNTMMPKSSASDKRLGKLRTKIASRMISLPANKVGFTKVASDSGNWVKLAQALHRGEPLVPTIMKLYKLPFKQAQVKGATIVTFFHPLGLKAMLEKEKAASDKIGKEAKDKQPTEKTAVLTGATVGGLMGGLMGQEGQRMESTGRGIGRGVGAELGSGIGALGGTLAGAGLGGLAGGAGGAGIAGLLALISQGRLDPGLLASLSSAGAMGGAGLGSLVGGIGGLVGGPLP